MASIQNVIGVSEEADFLPELSKAAAAIEFIYSTIMMMSLLNLIGLLQ